jgi:hypothetical protein
MGVQYLLLDTVVLNKTRLILLPTDQKHVGPGGVDGRKGVD